MHVVALAWIYVVLMMVLAEALGPGGSVLGALSTALLYGALPLGLVLYIGGARARARGRRRAAERERAAAAAASEGVDPGGGGQAAGEAVAPVGEEAR
jgi:membrane protein implicated in regulation of membrane protease activity